MTASHFARAQQIMQGLLDVIRNDIMREEARSTTMASNQCVDDDPDDGMEKTNGGSQMNSLQSLPMTYKKSLEYYLFHFPIMFQSLSCKFVQFLANIICELAFGNLSANMNKLEDVYFKIIFRRKHLWIDLIKTLFKSQEYFVSRSFKSYSSSYNNSQCLHLKIEEGLKFLITNFIQTMRNILQKEINDLNQVSEQRLDYSTENDTLLGTWFYLLMDYCFLDRIQNDLSNLLDPKFKNYTLFDACSGHRRLVVFYLDLADSQNLNSRITQITSQIAKMITMDRKNKEIIIQPRVACTSEGEDNNTYRDLMKPFIALVIKKERTIDVPLVTNFVEKHKILRNLFNLETFLSKFVTTIGSITVHSSDFLNHEILERNHWNTEFETIDERKLEIILKNTSKFFACFLEYYINEKQLDEPQIISIWEIVVSLRNANVSMNSTHILQRNLFQELSISKLVKLLKIFDNREKCSFFENNQLFAIRNDGKTLLSMSNDVVESVCCTLFFKMISSNSVTEYFPSILRVYKLCDTSYFKILLSKVCKIIVSDIVKNYKGASLEECIVASNSVSYHSHVNIFLQFLSSGNNEEQTFVDILNYLMLETKIQPFNDSSKFLIHTCLYWATIFHYSESINFSFLTWISNMISNDEYKLALLICVDERIIFEDLNHARNFLIAPIEGIGDDALDLLSESYRISILSKFSNRQVLLHDEQIEQPTVSKLKKLIRLYNKDPNELLDYFNQGSIQEQEIFCRRWNTLLTLYALPLPKKATSLFNFLKISLPEDHPFHSIIVFRTLMDEELSNLDSPLKKKNFITSILDSKGLVDTNSLSFLLLKLVRDDSDASPNNTIPIFKLVADSFEKYQECFLIKMISHHCKILFLDMCANSSFSLVHAQRMINVFELVMRHMVDPSEISAFLDSVLDASTCKLLIWENGANEMPFFLKTIFQLVNEIGDISNQTTSGHFPLFFQRVYFLFSHPEYVKLLNDDDEVHWWMSTLKVTFKHESLASIVKFRLWIFWLQDITSTTRRVLSDSQTRRNYIRTILELFLNERHHANVDAFLKECFMEMLAFSVQILSSLPPELFSVIRSFDKEAEIAFNVSMLNQWNEPVLDVAEHSSQQHRRHWFLEALALLSKKTHVTSRMHIAS
ncbi:hypothetical protein FDP41_000346 [Naegleria fowleri]|uniref:Uncharacterized protein n=1 Tax=Naegleria fowleri TaxID=5763 RepID=A0A6A5C570_NAEFO|nr:uncharacterized protein FDP41_000346 [Naegleria fowleri]KAF0984447.1 hypothetical protein FDP41_000346 [Naegleria fowleri]